MPRMKRCPRCKGTGSILGHASYPGTGAHRPTLDCPVCHRTGRVPVRPPAPQRKPFMVKLEVMFWAEGKAHADMLGREFTQEALSSMQYSGSIKMGESTSIVRSPAEEVEEV